MIKKIFFLNYILFLVASCQKEVHIDLPKFTQKLVVDGRIETNSPPIIILSKSQDLYAPTDLNAIQNNFVSGAVITVSDGTNTVILDEICSNSLPDTLKPLVAQALGIDPSVLATTNYCAYTTFNSAIFGQVGKTYSLKINLNDSIYTSSTTLVAPPVLSSMYYKYDGTYTDRGYGWMVINDNSSVYNTYFLQEMRINVNSDTRFYTPSNPVFDDAYFNGLNFDFAFPNAGNYHDDSVADDMKGYFQVGDTVVVKFSAMDLPVYNFMLQKYAQVDNGGNPFASPANIPTNIIGGALGVWAGFSTLYDTLACYP